MIKPILVKPVHEKRIPEDEDDAANDPSCSRSARNCLNVFLVTFLYAFALHAFINSLVVSLHYESFAMMFEKLGWVVRAIVAAVTTHQSLQPEPSNQDRENELLKKTKIKVFEEPQRIFVKSVVISWCVTITFWLLKTALMAWYFSTRCVQDYFSHSFYALNVENLGISNGAAAAIAVLNWTINNCASLLGGLHLTELIWKCYNLQKGVEQLDAFVTRYGVKLRVIRSQDLKETHLMYIKLRHNLLQTEARFSFPIFLWILEVVIGVVCCICGVHAVITQDDTIVVAEETVEIIYYMMIFAIMCYEVSEINVLYSRFLMTLGEIAAYLSYEDANLCNQFHLLKSTVHSSKLALTAWKFFPLDRPQSLSIIGVVVAYSVILLHLSTELTNPNFT